MRYLITGGAGFIGSHLTDVLLARGDQVVVLDDLSTGRHDNIREHLTNPNFEFVMGSILNEAVVDDVVRRVDVVLHLAAAVGVELIVGRPLESLATNIRGSEIVLEKCHKYGRKVLVTSTSEIYGKNDSDLLSEEDDRILGSPLKTRWSYSEAKAIEEVLAYSYWREKGLPVVIVRLFNTVGPRQVGHYGMVVPRFVEQALKGAPISVYGDGTQRRCFCHVADVVRALLGLVDSREAEGQVFNVGANEEISIAALADTIIEQLGSDSAVVKVSYDDAYEEGFEDMPRRVPNTARVNALVGWQPQLRLNNIIADVAADISGRV
ncbi:MAG: NAD-dependent epimerase/dehydratase family protein [Candidatus Nanopelagicales bacterium]|jgi:UDP-glucose 4-epimerase